MNNKVDMEQQQIFLNTVEAHFNLRKPKGNNPTIIYLVVRMQGKQYKFSLGCKVYPSQWDKKKQRAFISPHLSELDNRNNFITNNKVSRFVIIFGDSLQYICNNLNEIDNFIKILRSKLNSKGTMSKNKENALIRMRNLVDGKDMKQGSKRAFNSQIETFKKFIEETLNKSILHWDEITLALLSNYKDWLHKQKVTHDITHEEVFEEDNTVIDKMSKIYTILKYAEEKELIDLQETKICKLKSTKNKKDKVEENQIYLTEDELQSIFNLPLNGKKEKVRDLFCFQNEIGQRYEDINGICPRIIKSENGKYEKIEITQKKTNKHVTPPITETAKMILEKYNYKLPEIPSQTANKLLKELAKEAGINRTISICEMRNGEQYNYTAEAWQCVGTHTARRSFVSNGLKDNDSSVLKKITGHSTNSAFERYNRLGSEEAADIIMKNKTKSQEPQQEQVVPAIFNSTIAVEYIERNAVQRKELYDTINKQKEELQQQKQEANAMRKQLKMANKVLNDYEEGFSVGEYTDRFADMVLEKEED